MKTSARNQFAGTVKSVDLAPVSAQVVIELPGGVEIVSTMTRSAAERLKVRQGQAAVALIKASSVAIVTEFDGYVLSARNQLAGTVSQLERGAVSSLVTLTLASGLRVSASVTNEAVDDLALKLGANATAVFKAYSVIVGVKP
jgi:molybdate transport system regulatory protein